MALSAHSLPTPLECLDGEEMRALDAEFEAVMPGSQHRMADHTRAHPDRFPTNDEEMR
jgi:hypothetical protein